MNEKELAAYLNKFPRYNRLKDLTAGYVWGTTFNENGSEKKIGKIHIIYFGQNAKGEDEFKTLCGIDDTPGNWRGAAPEWFKSDDACLKCQAVLDKLGVGKGWMARKIRNEKD